jgi:hypothetical protein
MNIRHNFMRLVGLTLVVSMPLLGMSAVASAKSAKAAKGSAAWCAAHPKQLTKAVCASVAAGTGGASGAGTDPIVVSVGAPCPSAT